MQTFLIFRGGIYLAPITAADEDEAIDRYAVIYLDGDDTGLIALTPEYAH